MARSNEVSDKSEDVREMKSEIDSKNKGDEGTKERDRIKAKISGLNSQLDALTEKLSMLPKSVSPTSFFKQMEKISLLKQELEEKLLKLDIGTSKSNHTLVKEQTFEQFCAHWKRYLATANDEMKKKIIHKFIRKIEIGKNEVTIHWLVDEDHYKSELAITANSPYSGENRKYCMVGGSQSLKNGAP